MKYFFKIIILLIIIGGCQPSNENKLTIATAANMQFAMKELVQIFSKETGIDCQTIISSSGKLKAQIQEGAPFDIFVSADLKYPNELHNIGWTLDTPKVYAHGKLVLWSFKEFEESLFKQLKHADIQHIAIANPKTAPYGKAAIDVFQYFKVYENVKDKLVFGESIAQTNQFITTQSAEIGFTAKSVVLSSHLADRGIWEDVPIDSYQPIEQGVVILKHAEQNRVEAQQFFDFLFSIEAKSVLEKYGYESM